MKNDELVMQGSVDFGLNLAEGSYRRWRGPGTKVVVARVVEAEVVAADLSEGTISV